MPKRHDKSQQTKQRLAVIGGGRLGRACAREILADTQLCLAGMVRRPQSLGQRLPAPLHQITSAAHISELEAVDAALICVPTLQVLETARSLLQQRVPIVECATLHGDQFQQHKQELDRLARHHESCAIVAAGWDPGALSLLRGLFASLIPKGQTETTHRPGLSLHHSGVAHSIPGVRKALASELLAQQGQHKRYLYLELEEEAELEAIERRLNSEPLFIGEELVVLPLESAAALEDAGHGIVMERREDAAYGHQLFLLEARLDEALLAARMMVAAARALPTRHHRAYSLFDLPQRVLWQVLPEQAERDWL